MSLYYFFLIPVLGLLFVCFMKAKLLINKKPKLNYISLFPGNEDNEVFIKLPSLQLFLGDYHNTNTGRPIPKSPEPFNYEYQDKIDIYRLIEDKNEKISVIPGEFKKDLDKPIKETGLMSSMFILIISYIIYMCFDLSTNQLEFIREYYNIGFFDICLGIDGSSIYFVVRPLTDIDKNNLQQFFKSFLLLFMLAGCIPRFTSKIYGLFAYFTWVTNPESCRVFDYCKTISGRC
jgi:hypothetical protein